MTDSSASTTARLAPRIRLFGFLMLGMGAWIALGVAATAGWSRQGMPIVLPASLNQALTALIIVGVVCLMVLVVAGIGTLLGRRQALVLGSLAAGVYSGAWWLGAALMPWHPAVLIEGILLLVLIAVSMLAGDGAGGRRSLLRLTMILIIFWVVVLGMYAVIIGSVTDPAVRALAPRPLAMMADAPAVAAIGCEPAWQAHVCVPQGYQLKIHSPQVSAWRASKAAALVLMAGTAFDSSYRGLGFPSPFAYEQAVWNSHVHPGILVVVKGMVSEARGHEELYTWTTSRSRGFLTVRRRAGSGHWFVSADVYPAGAPPFTLMSQAPGRKQALAPVLATIAGGANAASQTSGTSPRFAS